jgi:hypothetical protein
MVGRTLYLWDELREDERARARQEWTYTESQLELRLWEHNDNGPPIPACTLHHNELVRFKSMRYPEA